MTRQAHHIHLLGIGGTGMGALAQLFVEQGHRVTGTDTALYPPMSDQLAALGVQVFVGFSAANLTVRPDLVIVGNVITKTNPEAQEVLRLVIPYRSMPAALAEYFLINRTPLVVTGTHGKTTTATLLAWLLERAGEHPGYFIGGVGKNFERNAAAGTGPYFVVEGDEYDTAFFDKGPKFLHYRPQAAILTSVEFDHADIYRDLDHLKTSFRRFIDIIPPDGMLIVCADDPGAAELARDARCRVVRYGMSASADYVPEEVVHDRGVTSFVLGGRARGKRFSSPLAGEHNLANTIACLALLLEAGIDAERLAAGLQTFAGVRRRQEIVGEAKGMTIIDDFAHHPTAVAKTIAAIRERYPGRRLWAIFEPRSATSRRNIFQQEYVQALAGADRVVIADVYKAEGIPVIERLNPQIIADQLMNRGVDAHFIATTPFILEYITRNIDAGDVVLIMSNGGFDGIPQKLLAKLDRRRIVTDMTKVKPSRIPKARP